jgi:phage-related protein
LPAPCRKGADSFRIGAFCFACNPLCNPLDNGSLIRYTEYRIKPLFNGGGGVQEYEIEFYDKADGSEPAKEFILALDAKMRAKVVRTVGLLREEGPSLREPYSKHLEDGIFEIRTKFGSDITRVLYFFVIGRKIILTNGFVKKTQKTPASEIALAKQYRADYLSRKECSK